jgi:hypothetical protein
MALSVSFFRPLVNTAAPRFASLPNIIPSNGFANEVLEGDLHPFSLHYCTAPKNTLYSKHGSTPSLYRSIEPFSKKEVQVSRFRGSTLPLILNIEDEDDVEYEKRRKIV